MDIDQIKILQIHHAYFQSNFKMKKFHNINLGTYNSWLCSAPMMLKLHKQNQRLYSKTSKTMLFTVSSTNTNFHRVALDAYVILNSDYSHPLTNGASIPRKIV